MNRMTPTASRKALKPFFLAHGGHRKMKRLKSLKNGKFVATEDQEQIALIEWSKNHKVLREYLIHIPNGGSRHLLEAVKLKKMGTQKGVPDLFLPYPVGHYSGLWIEMKRNSKHAKPTPEQNEWLERLTLVGYCCYVCKGFDEAKHAITQYLTQHAAANEGIC